MTTDQSNQSSERPAAGAPALLVPGANTVLYGFVAAGGTVALLNGIRSYQQYADGQFADQFLRFLGILVTLGIGFTLLLVALAATVAMGVEHARAR